MQDEPNEVRAIKAPVAPRARRVDSDIALRLDQLILPFVERRATGVIYLIAPAGAGKTVALGHLRAVLPADANIAFFDDPQFDHWMDVVDRKLTVVATTKFLAISPLDHFELAGWTQDDCLEYLASTHREQCASVMQRLVADPLYGALAGSPAHLSAAMDEMAAEPSVQSIGEALRRMVRRQVRTEKQYLEILRRCEPALNRIPLQAKSMNGTGIDDSLSRFCAQQGAAIALGCEFIAHLLAEGSPAGCLGMGPDRVIIHEIASACRLRPKAIVWLDQIIGKSAGQPVGPAAGLRLAIDPQWRIPQGKCLDLSRAYLRGAQWAQVDLSHTKLQLAVLTRANLSHALLNDVMAHHTDFTGACLAGAKMNASRFAFAKFDGANLASIKASGSFFNSASFKAANLSLAILNQAALGSACLADANLVGAQFIGAHFYLTDVSDAVFDGAVFTGARFKSIMMSGASWVGASFEQASILCCVLDGLSLPEGNFNEVDFTGSTLSGTTIPGGRFHRACFRQAGLADIEWPNADLRKADFTHASFHMGSSRSGLVGSVIPCEGSKTGFYTDDFNEQDFKCPEEIRKANLCGADLRGAIVGGTDWYLVDLRGAKYTPDQAEHFVRCKAILHSRVAD